jgi:hypothetical protein
MHLLKSAENLYLEDVKHHRLGATAPRKLKCHSHQSWRWETKSDTARGSTIIMLSRRINKHLILCRIVPIMSLLLCYTSCAAFQTQSNQVRHSVQRAALSACCSSSTRAVLAILRKRTVRFHSKHPLRYQQPTAAFSTKLPCVAEPDVIAESGLSKWAFLPRKKDGTSNKSNLIENVLVCGDGDLSFSADIASELESLNITLFATVLEDEATHNQGEI